MENCLTVQYGPSLELYHAKLAVQTHFNTLQYHTHIIVNTLAKLTDQYQGQM